MFKFADALNVNIDFVGFGNDYDYIFIIEILSLPLFYVELTLNTLLIHECTDIPKFTHISDQHILAFSISMRV